MPWPRGLGLPRSPRSLGAWVAGSAALAVGSAWGLVAWRPDWPGWIAAGLSALAGLVPLSWAALRLGEELGVRQREARSAGGTDELTGAATRTAFLALAEREFARSRRYGNGAALLLVDVDRFRRVLDGRDESAGDLVLAEISRCTLGTLRGADALARFGTAQMAVFLAQADPLGALDVGERIRERIEQIELPWRDQRLRVTVSVGVAMMRPAHLSLQAVIDDAEAALGAARHAGGNCVRAAPVDPRRLASQGPSVGDNNKAAGPKL